MVRDGIVSVRSRYGEEIGIVHMGENPSWVRRSLKVGLSRLSGREERFRERKA